MRTLLAVGGNDAAALSAGINIANVRTAAYALGGLFAAMGGIAMAAVFRSADPNTAMQYTLIALAAVALGGTPLTGGRGGITGSAIGAAVIFMIQNLLAALQVSNDLLPAIYGALLIVAIVLGFPHRRRTVQGRPPTSVTIASPMTNLPPDKAVAEAPTPADRPSWRSSLAQVQNQFPILQTFILIALVVVASVHDRRLHAGRQRSVDAAARIPARRGSGRPDPRRPAGRH